MLARRILALALGLACTTAIVPATASTTPKTYECQKPVQTGVEVYKLHNISRNRACPVALALFAWENASATHARALYGCHYPEPNSGGYPYLKLHSFHGWQLALVGKPYGEFRMKRGSSWFFVGGTDFPVNCS